MIRIDMSQKDWNRIGAIVKALDDPTRSGPQYFDSLVGSMVPSLLGQIARAHDPLDRRIDKHRDLGNSGASLSIVDVCKQSIGPSPVGYFYPG